MYLAVRKASQVVGNLLVVVQPVSPSGEVAFHLVGSEAHQFVALSTFRHGLQLLEDLHYQSSVVAHVCLTVLLDNGNGLGLGMNLLSIADIKGPVNV